MQHMANAAAGGGGRQLRHPTASPQATPPRRYDTAALFDGSAEIEIVHQGAVYRLKITRQGKLILNK